MLRDRKMLETQPSRRGQLNSFLTMQVSEFQTIYRNISVVLT